MITCLVFLYSYFLLQSLSALNGSFSWDTKMCVIFDICNFMSVPTCLKMCYDCICQTRQNWRETPSLHEEMLCLFFVRSSTEELLSYLSKRCDYFCQIQWMQREAPSLLEEVRFQPQDRHLLPALLWVNGRLFTHGSRGGFVSMVQVRLCCVAVFLMFL